MNPAAAKSVRSKVNASWASSARISTIDVQSVNEKDNPTRQRPRRDHKDEHGDADGASECPSGVGGNAEVNEGSNETPPEDDTGDKCEGHGRIATSVCAAASAAKPTIGTEHDGSQRRDVGFHLVDRA